MTFQLATDKSMTSRSGFAQGHGMKPELAKSSLPVGTILERALALARSGIPVFPCHADKSPRVRGGFNAASTDEAIIRGWWERFPDALVGVPTGSASGLVAIDIDPDGLDFLLGEYGELLETGRRHKTPRGFHYLFQAPADLSICGSVGKLAKGVDVRGDGGYIIWWPAQPGAHAMRGIAVAELPPPPPQLLELLCPKKPSSRESSAPLPIGTTPGIPTDELREILFNNPDEFDPNCDRDEWRDVGMALHYATRGSESGLMLWDEWSGKATRIGSKGKLVYWGLEYLQGQWESFKLDHSNPITDARFQKHRVAKPEEFLSTESTGGVATLPVPKAQHLCTDQANAERLQGRYGRMLIAVAGTFYAYDGKRWKADDRLPQRFACELSNMVKAETEELKKRVTEVQRAIPVAEMQAYIEHPRLNPLDKSEKGCEFLELKMTLEGLEKWSKKCEMKATQDAALGLLKKLLAVDAAQLDSSPWLLNCENGTLDLRIGELREHRASDRITRLAPVHFDPTAKAERFESFLAEIFAGDQALIEFTQCWFGYCATGDVREQCMVIHWGAGSNGKSTLIGTLASVLGNYASPLPAGMLTAKNSDSRHPAEIAMLRGARLVTASESEDGAKLREAFVKEVTGGDMLTARQMYGEWFDFKPTHKLQMLTNHKPQIRGSDHGIWRRLRLIPFTVTFGTAEEVTAGTAARLKDPTLVEALEREKAGILNWMIVGARRWHAEGLQPPSVVLNAGRAYREEQDRIGEFLRERYQLDHQARETYSALYNAYRAWCREAGIEYPLSRQRLGDELEQRGFRRSRSHGVRYVHGIALMPEVVDLMGSSRLDGLRGDSGAAGADSVSFSS